MYRGCKETYWEGGVRGAAFLHGKMLKNPGRTSHQLMHISDWLPTLMTVIGEILSLLGYHSISFRCLSEYLSVCCLAWTMTAVY